MTYVLPVIHEVDHQIHGKVQRDMVMASLRVNPNEPNDSHNKEHQDIHIDAEERP